MPIGAKNVTHPNTTEHRLFGYVPINHQKI